MPSNAHRNRTAYLIAALVSLACPPRSAVLRADTWTTWRGPTGDNHAAEGNQVPLRWNFETGENIAWKTPVPGKGHSTPIVTDDFIFLTTSNVGERTQSLLKFSRDDGRMLGQWVLHTGTLPRRIHPNNSHASPTPVVHEDHLLVSFYTDDAIVLSRVSFDGQIRWQKRVADFRPSRFQFGYGASPMVEHDVVIVAAEYDGPDSGIYGLDPITGDRVWKIDRPSNLNFASPIVAEIAGRRQLLIAGAKTMTGYDPTDGKLLWTIAESTEAICGTMVWDGRRVMVSGGNPRSGTWCVSGDGRPRSLWSNRVKCYEQSLLATRNYVYAVADTGVMYCWRTNDGKEMWKSRVLSGGVSASPLLVGDRIYAADESGNIVVIAANPARVDRLAKMETGDSIFASPVVVDDRIYVRTAVRGAGGRQEFLVAIGD